MSAQTADSIPAPNRLAYPDVVQSHERTTARDDAAIVQAIEHKIKCTCGCGLDVFTCRTTDFTCATSPAMHRAVLARLDSAMTSEQVVAAFERQYGEAILMQPPRRGFNWAAYLMPFAALLVGLGVVAWLMKGWVRGAGQRDGESEVPSGSVSGLPVSRSPGPP
ncbi:MAG TPA: cytochrome c-type biogenesis protein CcmH, partial [Gemmatimonadales bacterium]